MRETEDMEELEEAVDVKKHFDPRKPWKVLNYGLRESYSRLIQFNNKQEFIEEALKEAENVQSLDACFRDKIESVTGFPAETALWKWIYYNWHVTREKILKKIEKNARKFLSPKRLKQNRKNLISYIPVLQSKGLEITSANLSMEALGDDEIDHVVECGEVISEWDAKNC